MIRVLSLVLIVGCARPVREAAVPVPAVSSTPCVPGPPLRAVDIYRTLEKYAWSLYLREDEPAPPPTTYGSCRVDKNVVSAADGTVVAELGCGVRVLVPGIVDGLGLQVGARGQDVLDRAPAPERSLTCVANGPAQVRCNFERGPDQDTDSDWYVVAGALDTDVLTGAAARAYVASRELVEIEVSVWCH